MTKKNPVPRVRHRTPGDQRKAAHSDILFSSGITSLRDMSLL
jgi:hypothetical protein